MVFPENLPNKNEENLKLTLLLQVMIFQIFNFIFDFQYFIYGTVTALYNINREI